ncbi:hypothetical protein C8P63_12074 [Melghirimyces profundicolus]|uniref:Uncharacterized protein n=2 Tax=Melghirimyces profundicolus TaxID=1242148 RepID=A0A2T6BGU8_9BACL|nr:hypothetical protein C8P63_12074 [Melghirimyces profundicolus]
MGAFKVIKNRKGSATITWVVSLPVFLLIFLFLGGLTSAGMTYASTKQAADAGSIAATKKLDEWLLQDSRVQGKLSEIIPDTGENLTNSEKLNSLEKKLLAKVAQELLKQREDELKEYVRMYVQKNGAAPSGKITFPVHDKHIQVEAKTSFQPVGLEEFFQGEFIDGKGLGPEREYLNLLPEGTYTIEY